MTQGIWKAVAFFVTLGLVLAACRETPTGAPAPAGQQAPRVTEVGVTDDSILLGTHQPLSGPAASYSVIPRASEMYFKYINDQGGVNGRKIIYKIEDDGYQPPRTVEVVKKLVEQDKVFAIFNGLGTPTHSQVFEWLNDNKIPDMYIASGATKWTEPVRRYVFAFQPDYRVEGTLLARYAIQNLPGKKAGIFYQNDDFGKDGARWFEETLKKANYPVVARESFEVNATDMSSQIIKLRDAGAEVVLLFCVPRPCALFLKQAEQLGYKATFLMTAVSNDPEMFNTAGPSAMEGVITLGWLPLFDDTSNPRIRQHHEILQKYAPGLPPQNFTVYGQMAAEIMVETLRRAGRDLTREKLIDAAESIKDWKDNIAGIGVTMSPTDHRPFKAMRYMKFTGGKIIFISDYQYE
jgi:branched-chain amino acid transport system substrate-binding protein